ncbi:hypothetical protein V1478_000685 [Vespula squamosa]|uniref:Uncharacterized protein n=1 Tax=Vespula squamosa TaxID=30214 RepID=A0ABD2C666_VESSQ
MTEHDRTVTNVTNIYKIYLVYGERVNPIKTLHNVVGVLREGFQTPALSPTRLKKIKDFDRTRKLRAMTRDKFSREDTLGQVTRVDTGSPGVPSYPTLYEISTTMKLERPEKLWAFSVRRGEEEFLASTIFNEPPRNLVSAIKRQDLTASSEPKISPLR